MARLCIGYDNLCQNLSSFMRVCQPLPVALKAATTSGSYRTVSACLGPPNLGRPRRISWSASNTSAAAREVQATLQQRPAPLLAVRTPLIERLSSLLPRGAARKSAHRDHPATVLATDGVTHGRPLGASGGCKGVRILTMPWPAASCWYSPAAAAGDRERPGKVSVRPCCGPIDKR